MVKFKIVENRIVPVVDSTIIASGERLCSGVARMMADAQDKMLLEIIQDYISLETASPTGATTYRDFILVSGKRVGQIETSFEEGKVTIRLTRLDKDVK